MNVLIAEILVQINNILEHTKDEEVKAKLEKLKDSIIDFIEDFWDEDDISEDLIKRHRYLH